VHLMSISTSSRARRAVCCALVLAFSFPATAQAAPSNKRIEAARNQAREAQERQDDLAADLEEVTEDYLENEELLSETRGRIRATEADLDKAVADMNAAEAQLNHRAVSIYRNGRLDLVAVFVGVTDFQDLVSRLDLMRRVGSSDAAVVASVKDARKRIESAKAALESRKEEQTVLRDKARSKRAAIDTALEQQGQYLRSLNSKLKRLIADERERQARLARKRAEAAARRAASARRASGRDFNASTLGSAHGSVVPIARKYVNKTPYVWGGTTPSGFDCSGLVLYCYRKIGISLPRTSRQQFTAGSYIPPDRLDLLKPGDLVFFGRDGDPSRIHHVAIFIGDGKMLHAPQTGRRVSIDSFLDRVATRGDYVGGCRP